MLLALRLEERLHHLLALRRVNSRALASDDLQLRRAATVPLRSPSCDRSPGAAPASPCSSTIFALAAGFFAQPLARPCGLPRRSRRRSAWCRATVVGHVHAAVDEDHRDPRRLDLAKHRLEPGLHLRREDDRVDPLRTNARSALIWFSWLPWRVEELERDPAPLRLAANRLASPPCATSSRRRSARSPPPVRTPRRSSDRRPRWPRAPRGSTRLHGDVRKHLFPRGCRCGLAFGREVTTRPPAVSARRRARRSSARTSARPRPRLATRSSAPRPTGRSRARDPGSRPSGGS